MKKIYYLGVVILFLTCCNKPTECPNWNPEGYNSVASAECNFKDKESDYVMVTGWMYEEHATAEESLPYFYISDTLWSPGDDHPEHWMIVDAYGYSGWNPSEFRGKKLYITGGIKQIALPENGHNSTVPYLFPSTIDTVKQINL